MPRLSLWQKTSRPKFILKLRGTFHLLPSSPLEISTTIQNGEASKHRPSTSEGEEEAYWRFVSPSIFSKQWLTRLQDHNPKAFAFANPGRLAKSAARSHDVCDPYLFAIHSDICRSKKNDSMFPKSTESPKNPHHDSSQLLDHQV